MPSALGRRLLLWGPPAIYMYFIFFLSSEADPLPQLTRVIWDKALHGAGYAVLGALIARACSVRAGPGAGRDGASRRLPTA